MARELQSIRMTLLGKDEREITDPLKELSNQHGGAWVAVRRGFSLNFDFVQFKNPSSVPDEYHDLARKQMGWKGQIRGFTPAAIRRESQRGLRRY